MGRTPIRVSLLSLAAPLLLSCSGSQPAASSPPSRELINPDPFYAAASRFGDLVWTAGHIADGPGPIEKQVEETLDNLEETLEASGAGFDTLLKVNVYLTDWDDWDAFNTIYVDRIGPHGTPPRTTVEVADLALEALIEIEMVAHVRTSSP